MSQGFCNRARCDCATFTYVLDCGLFVGSFLVGEFQCCHVQKDMWGKTASTSTKALAFEQLSSSSLNSQQTPSFLQRSVTAYEEVHINTLGELGSRMTQLEPKPPESSFRNSDRNCTCLLKLHWYTFPEELSPDQQTRAGRTVHEQMPNRTGATLKKVITEERSEPTSPCKLKVHAQSALQKFTDWHSSSSSCHALAWPTLQIVAMKKKTKKKIYIYT